MLGAAFIWVQVAEGGVIACVGVKVLLYRSRDRFGDVDQWSWLPVVHVAASTASVGRRSGC
jgi:hypothetical protein